jgi:hypothetical protein
MVIEMEERVQIDKPGINSADTSTQDLDTVAKHDFVLTAKTKSTQSVN